MAWSLRIRVVGGRRWLRDFERARRDVGGLDFGVGEFSGEGERDGAGAGADVGDPGTLQPFARGITISIRCSVSGRGMSTRE